MPDYKGCLVSGNTLTTSISYYCLKHCTRMQGCSSFCNAKKVWALNLLPRKAQLVNRDRKLELPHHNPSTSAGDAHKKGLHSWTANDHREACSKLSAVHSHEPKGPSVRKWSAQ